MTPLVPIAAGALLAEQAMEMKEKIEAAAAPKVGIGQYLVASGGGQQPDNAMPNAVLSALNRLAGFKSRI